MTRTRSQQLFLPLGALFSTAALLGCVHASAVAAPDSPEARYLQERAACLAGRTAEDQRTCLQEAGAAFAQARRGGLEEGTVTRYGRNALERCAPLPDEDRVACVARMKGLGTTSGSVAGGGILRELVIKEIIVPDAANSPDATSP